MDIPQDFLSLFYKEEKRFLIDSLLNKKDEVYPQTSSLSSHLFQSMN